MITPDTTKDTTTAGCGRCEARWGGLNTSHCGGCHETFTSLSAFDKHRAGSHPDGTRHCLPPESAGLVRSSRAYPCWGQAGADDRQWPA